MFFLKILYNYKDFNGLKEIKKEENKFEMRGFRFNKEKDINSVKKLNGDSLIYWILEIKYGYLFFYYHWWHRQFRQ